MRIKGMMKKKNDRGLNYKVTVRHKNNKVFSFWEDEVNLEHVWSDILFGLRDSFVCELATWNTLQPNTLSPIQWLMTWQIWKELCILIG